MGGGFVGAPGGLEAADGPGGDVPGVIHGAHAADERSGEHAAQAGEEPVGGRGHRRRQHTAGAAAVTNYRGKRHVFMLRTKRPAIAPAHPQGGQGRGRGRGASVDGRGAAGLRVLVAQDADGGGGQDVDVDGGAGFLPFGVGGVARVDVEEAAVDGDADAVEAVEEVVLRAGVGDQLVFS